MVHKTALKMKMILVPSSFLLLIFVVFVRFSAIPSCIFFVWSHFLKWVLVNIEVSTLVLRLGRLMYQNATEILKREDLRNDCFIIVFFALFQVSAELKTTRLLLFLSGGTNRSRHTSLSFNAGKMHSENPFYSREEVLLIERTWKLLCVLKPLPANWNSTSFLRLTLLFFFSR